MDGIGWGEAANDDGSGTALVMEIARVFSGSDVVTDRSIRFALWNNEETGLNGARAYVDQRKDLQGKEDPAGSGKYPEPKWLGMIQHDMMMFDHGMPHKDGTMSKDQRPEADVNIEYQIDSRNCADGRHVAWRINSSWRTRNMRPIIRRAIGPHMTNTDSTPFKDLVPPSACASWNAARRSATAGIRTHHQPTDVYSIFRTTISGFGLNAAQTTLGAIAQLVGAKLQ